MNEKSDGLVQKLFDINVQQIADIAEIKAKVGSIEKKIVYQNGQLVAVCEKVAKHDVIFGKIGVIITAAVFAISIGVNFIVDWLKSKFN